MWVYLLTPNLHVTWKLPLPYPSDVPKLSCQEIGRPLSPRMFLEPYYPQALPIALLQTLFLQDLLQRKRTIKRMKYSILK